MIKICEITTEQDIIVIKCYRYYVIIYKITILE